MVLDFAEEVEKNEEKIFSERELQAIIQVERLKAENKLLREILDEVLKIGLKEREIDF